MGAISAISSTIPAMVGENSIFNEQRLSDERVLAVIGERLTSAFGREWTVEPGRLKGPGTLAVQLGADHTGLARHLDIDFVLSDQRPGDTTVPDCVTGYGASVEDAVGQAADTWVSTTAAALHELLDQKGQYADHQPAGAPDGFPGWHSIHSGIAGWGQSGGDTSAVANWIAAHPLAPHLAPVLAGDYPRDHLVGLKILLGGDRESVTAEVRVNGVRHEAASDAVGRLPFPRGEHLAFARCFILLVHNEAAAH